MPLKPENFPPAAGRSPLKIVFSVPQNRKIFRLRRAVSPFKIVFSCPQTLKNFACGALSPLFGLFLCPWLRFPGNPILVPLFFVPLKCPILCPCLDFSEIQFCAPVFVPLAQYPPKKACAPNFVPPPIKSPILCPSILCPPITFDIR